MMKKLPILLLVAIIVIMSVVPVSAAEQVNLVPNSDAAVAMGDIDSDDATITSSENDVDPTKPIDVMPMLDVENNSADEEANLTVTSLAVEVDSNPVVEEAADVTKITSLSEINGSGKYALTNDIVNEFVTINATWDVTVDFNGFYISVNTGRPFTNNGNLTLEAPNGGGVENAPGTGFGAVSNNSGALVTVNGGTFTSNNDGSAIRNAGGTAIINGGTFYDIRAIANMGVAVINGGTFNQISNAAYIIHSNGVSTTINNAVVNGNNGGVAHNKGHLEINSGTFSANTFYALYINKESSGGPFTAEINGGTFTSSNQVGLFLDVSKTDSYMVEINGGSFSGVKGAASILGTALAEGGYASPVITGGTFEGTDVNPFVLSTREQNLDNAAPEWTVVNRSYNANVESGKFTAGTDRFVSNEAVAIVAETPAKGMIFDKWISEEVQFENKKSPVTSFVMPEKEVTVIATYTEAPEKEIAPKANFETVFKDTKGPLTAKIEKPEGSFLYITIKVKNATKTMMSIFSEDDDSYTEIFVDPSNYTIGEDGTTITLHEEFLSTLGGGEYVVSAVFSGGIASLPLAISEENAPEEPAIEDKTEEKTEAPSNSSKDKVPSTNSNNKGGNAASATTESMTVLEATPASTESVKTVESNEVETMTDENSDSKANAYDTGNSPLTDETERAPFSPLAGLIAGGLSSLGFIISKFIRRK